MSPRRPPAARLAPVWTATDRALAVLAHAAIALGFLGVGFLLSLAINAVLWLVSRHRPHVAVHAEQAGTYQLLVLVVNVAVVAAWLAASAALFGRVVIAPPGDSDGAGGATPWAVALWLLAVPAFALWYVGTIALGLLGALRVARGHPFWYPLVGPWARRKHPAGTGSA